MEVKLGFVVSNITVLPFVYFPYGFQKFPNGLEILWSYRKGFHPPTKKFQNPSKVFELVIFARENPTYILHKTNQVFIIRIEMV